MEKELFEYKGFTVNIIPLGINPTYGMVYEGRCKELDYKSLGFFRKSDLIEDVMSEIDTRLEEKAKMEESTWEFYTTVMYAGFYLKVFKDRDTDNYLAIGDFSFSDKGNSAKEVEDRYKEKVNKYISTISENSLFSKDIDSLISQYEVRDKKIEELVKVISGLNKKLEEKDKKIESLKKENEILKKKIAAVKFELS